MVRHSCSHRRHEIEESRRVVGLFRVVLLVLCRCTYVRKEDGLIKLVKTESKCPKDWMVDVWETQLRVESESLTKQSTGLTTKTPPPCAFRCIPYFFTSLSQLTMTFIYFLHRLPPQPFDTQGSPSVSALCSY